MPENTVKYYNDKLNEYFDSSKANMADIELSKLIDDENKLLNLGRKLSKNDFVLSELPKLITKEETAFAAWLIAMMTDKHEVLKLCINEQVNHRDFNLQSELIAAFSFVTEQKRERTYKLLTTIFSGTDSEVNAYLYLFLLSAQTNDIIWLEKAWRYLQPRISIEPTPLVQRLKLGWLKLKELQPLEQIFDASESLEQREDALYWLLLANSSLSREQLKEYIFSGKVYSPRLFQFLPQGHVDELVKAYRSIENESVARKVMYVKGMNAVGDASLKSFFFKIASISEGELLRAAHQSIMKFIPQGTSTYQQALSLDEKFDTEEVLPSSDEVIFFWRNVRGSIDLGVRYGDDGVFDIRSLFAKAKFTPYREQLTNILMDIRVWTGLEFEFNHYAKLSEQMEQCKIIERKLEHI
ncbi:hypothetical protein V4D06_10325 [Vibrio mimicus]|uniref:hypothetical protein n=1 Tax=Vibrio mimicus TaxID=674 RepID=UPI002F959DA8